MRNFRDRIVMLLAFVLVLSAGLAAMPAAPQNPITAAREAFRKAQEEAKRKREEEQRRKQQPPQQPAQPQQPANAQAPPPAAASQPPSSAQGGTSQVVTLGDLDKSAAPAAPLDPKKMPDILGVHLGAPLHEAVDILKSQYPKAPLQPWTGYLLKMPANAPQQKQWTYAFTVNRDERAGPDAINVNVIEPPNMQVVWSVVRTSSSPQNINRGTLLAALREKYGKETVAVGRASTGLDSDRTTDDRVITQMWWLYDEQGRRAPMPGGGVPTLYSCPVVPGEGTADAAQYLTGVNAWCMSSYVALHVDIAASAGEIIGTPRYELIDVPLARRAGKITVDWKNAEAEKLRQQEIERSKQNKPKL